MTFIDLFIKEPKTKLKEFHTRNIPYLHFNSVVYEMFSTVIHTEMWSTIIFI